MRWLSISSAVVLFLASAASLAGDIHWFGPGYYEYQCGNNSDCRLVSGPHEKLSVCMEWATRSQEYIEDFYADENIAPHKCDYFADKPADTEHFSHG